MTVIRTGTGRSVRFRPRTLAVVLGSLLVAATLGVLAVGSGDYPLNPSDVVRALVGTGSPADVFIVGEVRLPRVVTALLAGAALGLSGAMFQSLVRNPLGSPDVLGVTQGATTGALIAILALGGGNAALSGAAGLGGLATGAAIYLLARRGGGYGSTFVLVGIGVAAILTGVNGYLLTRAGITEAARATRWLTGSLDGRTWSEVAPLFAVMCVVVPVVLLGCARGLTVLEMGDALSWGLGVRVDRLRLGGLALAVVLSSAAAAATGPVAFVALTAPQLARRLVRAPGPALLPSACVGAALLVAADLAGQRLVPDHQVPAGVMTGLLGGVYLMWLLAGNGRRRRA